MIEKDTQDASFAQGCLQPNTIITGDAVERLLTLPAQSVDMCVTSPPYYGLRDYGIDTQIGHEKTVEEYIQKLVTVFREVRRVLRNDGTLWVNIGDCYAGSNQGTGSTKIGKIQQTNKGTSHMASTSYKSRLNKVSMCKPKDLIGIPWMLAFALRADGWYLRQDIIWHKPNPMPESVTDRFTRAHEYIFLFSKQQKYYFDNDAIKEPAIHKNDIRAGYGRLHYRGKKRTGAHGQGQENFVSIKDKRNKRDVWAVSTKSYKGAHFAVYPPDLIRPCILAGSRKNGIVLDPFFGSGTTGLVAIYEQRKYVGIELNPQYVEIARSRLETILI